MLEETSYAAGRAAAADTAAGAEAADAEAAEWADLSTGTGDTSLTKKLASSLMMYCI
jgi:hypothetical protein